MNKFFNYLCFVYKSVFQSKIKNFTWPKIIYTTPLKILFTAAYIGVIASNSFGQREAVGSESRIGGTFFLGIPYSMFKEDSKHGQGINDGFGLFSLGFDVTFGNFFLLGSELGWDSPKDEKRFSDLTTAGELTSSVSLWHYSLSGGLKIPDIYFDEEKLSFTFVSFSFGHMWAFFEKRSIESCIDCNREEINIDGGLFIQPELYYVYGILGLGISYRHFFYSDYKSKAEFKLGLVFK